MIGFPDNKFTGGIAPALADLVNSGTVRIIDLVFIRKDADGFLDEEDILAAAEELDNNSSTLLIVWEDLWAAPLAAEIVASGGQLISGRRIPHQVVTEVLEAIEGNAS